MEGYYKYINILVVPTDFCNLRCKYCFHNEHFSAKEKMSLETLETIFKITLKNYLKVNFIWHGGEPLSMGVDFYKEVVRLQQIYNVNHIEIRNQIQTNLTLMNEELAEFFVENKFGVGGSFDGVKNDDLRGNSEAILKGREILVRKNGNCGMIHVTSKVNVDYLIDSYEFFKEKGINYNINTYLKTEESEIANELSLSSNVLIKKVTELFDYWLYDVNCNIKVRYFLMFIDYIVNRNKSICTYTSCLGKWVGIRPNGDITPCNRWFSAEYCYGNVSDYDDIAQAFQSKGFEKLLTKAIQRREKCKSCDIYDFCNGGCNNAALNENGVENNGGTNCESLKGIYRHIDNSMKDIISSSLSELDGTINPTLLRLLKKQQITKIV